MATRNNIFYESKVNNQLIDTRSKIIGLLIIVLEGTFLVDFIQIFYYTLFLLFIFLILKPKRTFLKQIFLSLPLILSLSLISFFSFNPSFYGNILFETTHSKISFAVFTAYRSIILISFILIIIHSEESFFDIIYGLDDMKLPRLLVNLLFLTYYFFNHVGLEFSRILEARSNRIYHERSIIHLRSLIIIGNILGASLARSFKRAENISASLSTRGFSSASTFSHPEKPWTVSGILFIIITLFISVFIGIYGQNSPLELVLGLIKK